MKGMGPKHERETIIRFDEEDGTVNIWTASEPVYRRLLKRGYLPTGDSERHAVFVMPKKHLKLPRQPSEANIAKGRRLGAAKRTSMLAKSNARVGFEGNP